MKYILFYFFVFIIYSFLGWVIEVNFVMATTKKFVNRGFLLGPYCPIYGITALLMHFLLRNFLDYPILIFVLSALLSTMVEFTSSYVMEKIFKTRWWDYTDKPFNFQGRICLSHTLMFGMLGTIFIYWVNPFTINIIKRLSITSISIISFLIFFWDFIASFSIIKNINLTVETLKKDYTREINKLVKEVILERSVILKYLNKRLKKRSNINETHIL